METLAGETTNKTALITGASRGLGAEFANQLAQLGYRLVLTARDKDRLEQVASTIRSKYPVQITIVPADLSKMPDNWSFLWQILLSIIIKS